MGEMADNDFFDKLNELKLDGYIELPKKKENKTCPLCNGARGFWIFNKHSQDTWKPCKCYYEAMRKRKLEFADIPVKYKDDTFDTYRIEVYENKEPMRKLKELCKSYVEQFDSIDKGLYIYGFTKGSGKTKMACTIGNELMKRGHDVKFATMGTILDKIKSTYNKESDYTEDRLMDELKTVEVLIIDDLGMENASKWANDKVYEIINYRYNAKKKTIYTSNISLKDMDYDDRIVSRISGDTLPIGWSNESVRDIEKKENSDLLKKMYRESCGL